MYRFALRPRWIVLHTVVLAIVVLFAVAGFWQLERLAERREHNALVLARRRMPLRSVDRFFGAADAAAYRRVRARGRFDVAREVVLRGRALDGRPGNHVLTPLVLKGSRAVIVDRGWVPVDLDSSPVVDALPPTGDVTVSGVLLPSEGAGPFATRRPGDRRTPEVVSRIDVTRLAKTFPYETFPLYLLVRTQEPSQRGELPLRASTPELSEGSHMIYAGQWFLFIPIAVVGYGAILRREVRKKA